ncbi:sigma 54-interacting transcriptional regulator [candidate division KSB1 bacterium]|nr:sigma 54-interacting transcriptional regulator [candidate division KSB1 bacterium]
MNDSERNILLSHCAIEQSSEAVVWLEADGTIYRANEAALSLYGYAPDEFIQKKFFSFHPNEDEQTFRSDWLLLDQQQRITKEHLITRKDGTQLPAKSTAIRIVCDGHTFSCHFIRDISGKRRSEAELNEALSEIERLKNRLQEEVYYLRHEIKLIHNFQDIITTSNIFKKILAKIEQVASTDTTVLILGETGTGKELLARAIHNISNRSVRPMIKVNCAALPATIIESELFGHEKGAFTGAYTQKVGRFELAQGTTIFLDEIGELSLELQVKLLQVLQEGEFNRLGGNKTIKVDARIITATNRNLERAIENGTFREDLFYRLNVFPIQIPPLRERKEDIPLLADYFVKKYNRKIGKQIDKIPKLIMDRLQSYHWPGNVRELEHTIERAVIVSQGNSLDLSEWLPKRNAAQDSAIIPLQEMEKAYILKAIKSTNGRISGEHGAAKVLGMKRTTLESKMKKLGIKRSPIE